MKLRTFLLTAIFLSLGFEPVVSQTENSQNGKSEIPKQVFEREEGQLPEDFATYPELETWAIYQSYSLDPDSGWIQDSICRMVPETGFKFLLQKRNAGKGTIYLYLDLVQFRPLPKTRFKPKKLNIFVNGKRKAILFSEHSKPFANPLEITLEPSEYPDGNIEVELVPSQNTRGRFWGIWDAYVLENQESSEKF